ncbi:MAG: S9 family peptidase, partial [Proteobacteria bacterium]|nr:S9 family peptidase [Pseudomonadota bacterium]
MRISIDHRVLSAILMPAAGVLLAGLFSGAVLAKDVERRPFQPADIHRIKTVGDIAIAPDGEWIAYTVGTTDVDKDTSPADLFMVNRDGSSRIQLTHTRKDSEGHPRFSPDGRYLAFIAGRDDGDSDDEDDPGNKSQVWLLNRAGGEAARLTELPGGVSDFEWSPDSTRLVLVARDPEEQSAENGSDDEEGAKQTHDTPKPIVIDRYQFKSDGEGYRGNRYQRLYLFDVAKRETSLLTDGAYDSTQPVWGPASDVIAFTSRRGGDPDRHDNSDIYVIKAVKGAAARQVTTQEGPDSSPVFSPDGKHIAYLQRSSLKYAGYDPAQLAVISSKGGEPVLPAAELDRNISSPRWSRDGKALLFLVADDRMQAVERVSARGGKVERLYPQSDLPGVVNSFAVGPKGVVTVTTFGQRPAEIYRLADGAALSDHNRAMRDEIDWATVEGFDSIAEDGVKIGSMLLKPPGFRKGVAYPTIVYVHGGPVSQDGYEFDATSQALAAQGYLVVNPNYRGSSGRGQAFSRAIYADWGHLEIQDIHAVVDNLVAQGLAD